MVQIILASTSQYRRQLLQNIGLNIECIGSDVDEKPILGKSPTVTSQLRAQAKAYSVIQTYFETTKDTDSVIVIGADQVVYIDGEIFGKPKSDEEWKCRLHKFSGRSHQLTTSVSLWGYGFGGYEQPKELSLFSEHTKIFFRELQESEINNYVNIGEAKKCAGGYMIEGIGASLIDRIEGDYQNVIGLPVFQLLKELRKLDVHVLK
jgi:septum formation protein